MNRTRIFLLHNIKNCLPNKFRRRNIRISQTKIKNIFFTTTSFNKILMRIYG